MTDTAIADFSNTTLRALDNAVIDRNKANDLLDQLDTAETAIREQSATYPRQAEIETELLPSISDIQLENTHEEKNYRWTIFVVWGVLVFLNRENLDATWKLIAWTIAMGIPTAIFWVVGEFLVFGKIDDRERRINDRAKSIRLEKMTKEINDRFLRKGQEAANALAGIETLRSKISTQMQNHVHAEYHRSTEICETLGYEGTISTDIDDPETRGKPLIKWHSPRWEAEIRDIAQKTINNETGGIDHDAIAQSTVFNALTSLEEMTCEIKVYSNQGSIISDDVANAATLLHVADVSSKDEFLDESPTGGQTLNYYLILETRFAIYLPKNGRYYGHEKHQEHVIARKRVTVPTYLDEAAKLQRDMEDHATTLKRQKFEAQYAKTVAKMSGNAADPEEALKAVLDQQTTKRAKAKQISDLEKRLEDEMRASGASEEEIEEALDMFYERISNG